MSFTTVWQAIISGLLNGAVYGLVSVGLTMIFGVVKIVNFAHGEFLMVGMYLSYALWALLGIDPIWSVPIVMAALFFFGIGMQKFFIRRVLNAPDLAQIFLTVGLSILMMNLALFLFRADFRIVKVSYVDWTFSLAGAIVIVPRLIACLGAILFSLLLALFLLRTDFGKAMRAVAQDREVAMLVGINPDKMYDFAVGIGAALAGAAGGLTISFYFVFPSVGVNFVLIAFVIVILGTLGNIKGAFLTSLIVGVAESVGVLFVGADLGLAVVFVILVLTLAFRPAGLLGRA
jgi:branched-chain amino acid transport system permease protein